MNIFKILSSFKGKVYEPSITSFLTYLLDPKKDHGISTCLLNSIIFDFQKQNPSFFSGVKKLDEELYKVSVIAERKVDLGDDTESDKDKRVIDIVIEITVKDKVKAKAKSKYIICIENKIRDSSLQKNQLKDELDGIKRAYENDEVKPEIYFCFITLADSDISNKEFSSFDFDKKIHMFWKGESSIQEKLLNILEMERKGMIDPISVDVSYILKSFILFIKSDFKSKEEEKESKRKYQYGKGVIEYFRDVANTLSDDVDYNCEDIKAQVRTRIFEAVGEDINTMTLNCQMYVATVNEKNRGHYSGVTRKNTANKNLFYYPDEGNKKIVRKYHADMSGVRVWTKEDLE